MSVRVPADGPRSARLVLIAEAPAAQEVAQGHPLVGPSGQLLARWMRDAGIARTDCWIDNVYPFQAPGNNIARVPPAELRPWQDDLHARIAALDDPWLIVPMGNVALAALTGKKGITKHRGSIYEYVDRRGRAIKVIPTIHPAAVFRQPEWEKRCRADWNRIGHDREYRDLRLPAREHIIRPTSLDVRDYAHDALDRADLLALDIETPRTVTWTEKPRKAKKDGSLGKQAYTKVYGTPRITCVGFSFEPSLSLTIPTTLSYWHDERALAEAWKWIRVLCEYDGCEHALQNGLFDTYYLAEDHGITVANYRWDTLAMHHCLTGDTKVLTGALDWIRLDEVQVGSELASFDENSPRGHRKLRLSKVLRTFAQQGSAYEVGFSNGETIVGTLEHKVLVGRRERHNRANGGEWKEIRSLRIGDEVWSIGRPWTFSNDRASGWLAGVFDGEGSTSSKLRVSVTQKQGPLLDGVKAMLSSFGFAFAEYKSTRANNISLNGGLATALRFLGQIRPSRLLQRAHNALALGVGDTQRLRGTATITSIRKVGMRKVFDITTTTGTFIANGILVHNCLDALDDHDLAYMASIDTRQPYWKDEAKDPDEVMKYASDLDAFHTYNGLDAAVTAELAGVYHGALTTRRLEGFYDDHYRAMFGPLLRLMRHGLAVDERARSVRETAIRESCAEILQRLHRIAGEPLHGKSGALSAKRVQRFLYETLQLPRLINRQTGAATANEVAVRRLMLRHPRILGEAGAAILDHRRQKKVAEFLDPKALDGDGRLRASFKFTTETGRLSSSKNPKRTGRNLQNIDREVRSVFMPDPRCVLLEADLSQAEARVVDVLTGHPEMIAMARRPPWEFDVHRHNATLIFACAASSVTKEQRYLAKRGVHASHYGLRGPHLADELLKDGYTYTSDECQRIIDSYLQRPPNDAIVAWQSAVRRRVMSHRLLVNSWGRRWAVPYDRLQDDLYRRAYAFQPQSEVADVLNQYGLVPLDDYLQGSGFRSRIHVQGHDSLLVSVPPDEAWAVACFLKYSLERPRTYVSPVNGEAVELTIPVEFKVGPSWGQQTEWKRMPKRSEFMDVVHASVRP